MGALDIKDLITDYIDPKPRVTIHCSRVVEYMAWVDGKVAYFRKGYAIDPFMDPPVTYTNYEHFLRLVVDSVMTDYQVYLNTLDPNRPIYFFRGEDGELYVSPELVGYGIDEVHVPARPEDV